MTSNPATPRTLIIGSGHLAYRLKSLAREHGIPFMHIVGDAFEFNNSEESRLDMITRVMRDVNLESLSAALVVDESDERNLALVIALISLNRELRIVASLFNENVAPHLQAAHPNIRVLNPAKIAAPTFIEALYTPLNHSLRYVPAPLPREQHARGSDGLIRWLVAGFATLIAVAVTYFHVADGMSLLNALYFVVVTVATVGYGDISLANASATSKAVGIALILSSTVFIWMIFSLTVDRIIKQRVQVSLGRRKHTQRNHVILCGLGRLGYFVAEGLIERGEDVLIIERDEASANVQQFRARGADVYIGDARLPGVLRDAGVTRAKALYSLVNSDFANAEIGLNARSFNPGMRLVLRIYDDSMSRMIKENLDIHLTYSMSALSDETFYQAAFGDMGTLAAIPAN